MSEKGHCTSEQDLMQPLMRELMETPGLWESLLDKAGESGTLATSRCRQPDWAAYYLCAQWDSITYSWDRKGKASHHWVTSQPLTAGIIV